jgi:hypothetical protein
MESSECNSPFRKRFPFQEEAAQIGKQPEAHGEVERRRSIIIKARSLM